MTTTTKRPWHMFYPLAGMLLISMIWSCYWYFAFTKAQEIAAIQREFYGDPGPAVTSIRVSGFAFEDLLVEIEAIAVTRD